MICDIFLYSGTLAGLCSMIMAFSVLRYLGRAVFYDYGLFCAPVPWEGCVL